MPSKSRRNRDIYTSPDKAVDLLYRQQLLGEQSDLPCTQPYVMNGLGLPDPVLGGKKIPFELPTRCRKCENCLLHRQRLWFARAMHETAASPRTWFGTLTLNPYERLRTLFEVELIRPSVNEGTIDEQTKFNILATHISKDITKMFKRLRSGGAQFRYLLVSEKHKDGFPHFHLLVHEKGEPIRKATLDGAWPLGFSRWKLVEEAGVGYVCKYLNKDAQTRVRASLHYGQAEFIRLATDAASAAISRLGPRP